MQFFRFLTMRPNISELKLFNKPRGDPKKCVFCLVLQFFRFLICKKLAARGVPARAPYILGGRRRRFAPALPEAEGAFDRNPNPLSVGTQGVTADRGAG